MQNKQYSGIPERKETYLDPAEWNDVYDMILDSISDDYRQRYGLWLEENEPWFWTWCTRLYFNNVSNEDSARRIERLLDIYVR